MDKIETGFMNSQTRTPFAIGSASPEYLRSYAEPMTPRKSTRWPFKSSALVQLALLTVLAFCTYSGQAAERFPTEIQQRIMLADAMSFGQIEVLLLSCALV